MIVGLLLLSCLYIVALAYDFNLSTNGSKLVTWVDQDGNKSSLLLFSLQTTQKKGLQEEMKLPYSFVVDENCSISQSLSEADIFSLDQSLQIQLQYIYMKNQTIINHNSVNFTTNTTLNLDNNTLLIIYSQDQFLSQSQSSTPSEENLYIYENQTLISFDSKMFSCEPECYKLSKMTTRLCQEKKCSVLSPQQVYGMGMGTVVENYSFSSDGRITFPMSGSSNEVQLVYLKLQQTNLTSSQLQQIKQEQVTISSSTTINVSFQLQLINYSSTTSSLRVESPDQSMTPTWYNVNITCKNSQPAYTIKTIKLYLGEQLIESHTIMFESLQQINFTLIWKGDQSQIPFVEIYSQNHTLQNRYSMNQYVDFLYNEKNQALKKSPNVVIQNNSLNEIQTVQTHAQKSPLIIVIIAVGGGLFIGMLVAAWFCRKRVFKCCCYQQQKQGQKEGQINDVKNDQICAVPPQTAKKMNNFEQLTFDTKQIFFKQTHFEEIKKTQNNKMPQINPQEVDGQNPQNQISEKALEKRLSSTQKQISDVKINASTP